MNGCVSVWVSDLAPGAGLGPDVLGVATSPLADHEERRRGARPTKHPQDFRRVRSGAVVERERDLPLSAGAELDVGGVRQHPLDRQRSRRVCRRVPNVVPGGPVGVSERCPRSEPRPMIRSV